MQFSEFHIIYNLIKYNKRDNDNKIRQQKIKKFVKQNGLIELKSNYLGCDSYFYSKKFNKIYKVSNVGDIHPVFHLDNDPNIIKLNNLQFKNIEIEKFIKKNNLIKLKSDYDSPDDYYWSNKHYLLYKIDNTDYINHQR